ncbi:ATP synthase F1, epsilon subunit [Geotalea daltonii FRC-32]|uniref:ATP synthase epsilon chain n=1 Tax=Geotalea daltonii (strain DSM 22248 / JCM 15807 / FRC-32) TaxID=316067 RepID=ATPE_GEODF|nr:F0F1 ATP synthase subunit epsilon [Geotalea daltonii]B9LZ83.1 RecName: Full=ATP synthase epsilon chain; AltName: Full=ATP synthase F1 sector epsilon subunit; AltName: Full=F-ATPase epsilon subunit [Geotalea daltonii FRC-32]ACM18815.1 ATP synthase F1, epsilon subunit [Geotalea daltonii FRC-32]
MAEKLKVELVTPYKKVLTEEVDEITATGALGEFGVLPGHAPFLTSLKIGELSYKKDGVISHLALNWGYFEVENDKVTVLVETAEKADEIDLERAKSALGRAEEALKKLNPEDKSFRVYEAALERALIRVQVAGKSGRR